MSKDGLHHLKSSPEIPPHIFTEHLSARATVYPSFGRYRAGMCWVSDAIAPDTWEQAEDLEAHMMGKNSVTKGIPQVIAMTNLCSTCEIGCQTDLQSSEDLQSGASKKASQERAERAERRALELVEDLVPPAPLPTRTRVPCPFLLI